MVKAEDEGRRVGVGKVDEVRARGGVLEVEGQQVRRRDRSRRVCVR